MLAFVLSYGEELHFFKIKRWSVSDQCFFGHFDLPANLPVTVQLWECFGVPFLHILLPHTDKPMTPS